MESWFKIETDQKNIAKKDGAKKFFECIFVLVLSILGSVLIFNKLSNKYAILANPSSLAVLAKPFVS